LDTFSDKHFIFDKKRNDMKSVFRFGKNNNKEVLRQTIYIRVHNYTLDFNRSLKMDISRGDWDFKNKTIIDLSKGSRTYEESQYLQELKNILNSIEQTFSQEFLKLKLSNKQNDFTTTTWKEWCEKILNKGLGINEETNPDIPFLLDKFRDYIDSKKRTWAKNTLRNYESDYKILECFMDFNRFVEVFNPDKELTLIMKQWYQYNFGKNLSRTYLTNEIDMKFYRQLEEWNELRGNSNNTFSGHIKHIRAVLKYYVGIENIPIHFNLNSSEFKSVMKSPEHDIFTPEELNLIFNYKGKAYLENITKLAKIQYYACMRFDELNSELKKGKNNLLISKTPDGHIWNIMQGKTGERKDVPIHSAVLELIESEEFPHLISEQKYRDYIKEILSAVGITKNKKIGTHTFRRSFCTNMFNANHSFQEISQYSGHSTEKQLRQYIQKKNVVFGNTISTIG
jgi:integrase